MNVDVIIYSILPVYLQFVFFVFFVVNRVNVLTCHRVILSLCHHNLVPLKSSEIETRIYIGYSPTYWSAQRVF